MARTASAYEGFEMLVAERGEPFRFHGYAPEFRGLVHGMTETNSLGAGGFDPSDACTVSVPRGQVDDAGVKIRPGIRVDLAGRSWIAERIRTASGAYRLELTVAHPRPA